MQPWPRGTRLIERPLRSDPPLDYRRLSDPILITRAKNGDREALAALCERHAPRVQRLASHLLTDPEDARDASQEALAKLCTRIGQFRGESLFSTWLHRLVVNTCRDVAARQAARRCEPLLEDRRATSEPDPAQQLARSELRRRLGDELLALSATQARVVVLKDAFDYSFDEIAESVRVPVGTAKCYAHRARKALRERLERWDAA